MVVLFLAHPISLFNYIFLTISMDGSIQLTICICIYLFIYQTPHLNYLCNRHNLLQLAPEHNVNPANTVCTPLKPDTKLFILMTLRAARQSR